MEGGQLTSKGPGRRGDEAGRHEQVLSLLLPTRPCRDELSRLSARDLVEHTCHHAWQLAWVCHPASTCEGHRLANSHEGHSGTSTQRDLFLDRTIGIFYPHPDPPR